MRGTIKKLPDGRWLARIRDANGKEKERTTVRKIDAERWLDEMNAAIIRRDYRDPRLGRTPLRAWAAEWLELQLWRDGTRAAVANSLNHILPVLGDRPLDKITKAQVQQFVNGLELAPSTVATVHQHLRTMLRAAVEHDRILRNPAVGVKLPKVNKAPVVPLTVEQVRLLTDDAPPFLRAAVAAIGAGLGLRSGEMLGLTADRVEWLRRQVRVDRQLLTPPTGQPALAPPKTEASYRTVPASAVVLETLTEHVRQFGTGVILDEKGNAQALLFHIDGRPIRRNHFTKMWRATVARARAAEAEAARQAGRDETPTIPADVRFHDLRHHFASLLISSGCSVKAVQLALGHASAKVTLDTYSHLWPTDDDRIRQAVEAMWRPEAPALDVVN